MVIEKFLHPFFIDRLHRMVEEGLKGSGIEFRPAVLGTVLE